MSQMKLAKECTKNEGNKDLEVGHKFLLNTIMALDTVNGTLKEDPRFEKVMHNLEQCNNLIGAIKSDTDSK